MSIFAIADLHLTQDVNKSMEKFGWIDYDKKIFENWQEKVTSEDLVIIPGDISWAMDTIDAYPDLEKIKIMPGKKVLLKGNHDYWWKSITSLNKYDKDMFFIQNNIFEFEDYVITGSRGWICPNDSKYTEHDEKMYQRETLRLENCLKLAQKTGKKIILIMHYPPTNDKKEPSNFTALAKKYDVPYLIYGHLHGNDNFNASIIGLVENTQYHLVSCDYLEFNLKKII
ncbi:metallophosphoesterase [Criibacterium bergeronii]|uniref:Serine/threonine protein phosphatase n=1 Tax=Criibacterium bergeronii TaxID=1871336 RepID=A0A371INU2_9FIRM|nr:metallophosphoesterase [Criibacterium bergeronii]MBS6062413.1 metallophosphoesterase [Peptostreptococcaceae bacterium]RDY22164.1 serine/threonine protein phosphatase [Criibacterium bergeronii]